MNIMAHPKSGSELSAGSGSPEAVGKHYFKQAWAYSQCIETESRATSHTIDLYSPKLRETRRKLREKCVQILLLSCSYRRKAEELLWKKGFYELTQRSKSNKQALDGSSHLYHAYSEHLSMATGFYTQLLGRLEEHYSMPVTSMDHSQLVALDANNADFRWLKDAAYRCLLYLGDLARYSVDIGGKPHTATSHYLHAISLDPTNGAPFNQLAALSGEKHEGLDAVYYYLRSMSSAKPFPGAEVNLQRILRKTLERLEALRGNKDRATETNIREATQSLLLVRLVTLQYMLSSSEEDKRSFPQPNSLTSFCEVLLSDFEECLNFDLQLFKDMTPACVSHVLSSGRAAGGGGGGGEEEEGDHRKVEELACLPHDLLLKVVALCILSSTQLRSQGSAQTPTLTSFAVSVFSLLLHHSFLRLAHLTRHAVHTLTRGTTVTSSTPVRHVGWTQPPDHEEPSEENNVVRIFLDRLAGEVLDEHAQQTPGIAKQLRVNSASLSSLGLNEAVNRLAIGPSQVWGGGEVASGSKSASSTDNRGRHREGGSEVERTHRKGAKGSEECSETTAQKKRGKRRNLVDRRRRRQRRADWEMTPISSEEEEEGSEETDSSQSSASTLSNSSTEEEEEEEEDEGESIDRIDSLSETSLSDGEEGERQAVVGGDGARPWTSGQVGGGSGGNVEKKGGERKAGRVGGKRQIVLAANFSGVQATAPTGKSAKEELKSSTEVVATATADDHLFQTLLLQTRHQAALHLACSLAAEDSYLMPVKIFTDWVTAHPLVLPVCAQGSPSLWSRLASLLNFLPPAQEIIAAGLRATLPPGKEWSQTSALREDVLLRGFAPLVSAHQRLQFEVTASPDILEQACNRICVLQKFGRHVSRTKATDLFQWDRSAERFMAPLQWDREKKRAAAAVHSQRQEKAAESRSKLMKAMAERRLQAEVDSLVKTSAQQEANVFTPYLLPDAQSLCTGLHLVRKLIASEKFIVIIAKSVIDALDSMKKGRENYAAREAIKFLERNLQGGGKMMRVQGPEETLQSPGTRKPPKMDLNTWRYSCLVDCALYFTHTFAERGGSSGQTASTLLLDQSIVKLVERVGGGGGGEQTSPLAETLCEAQLNGVSIDTVVRFHGKWLQSQSSHHHKASDRK